MDPPERKRVKKTPRQTHDALTAHLDAVYTGFLLKKLEVLTLAKTVEPETPMRSQSATKYDERAEPTTTQIGHTLRRIDLHIMHRCGFSYNTQRAYFQRDPLRSGRLMFPGDTVTLLGTSPIDDRFAPVDPAAAMAAPSFDDFESRLARIEAFFAMFERRQELTEAVSAAPSCLFIGNRDPRFLRGTPLPPVGSPGRRAPLLPQHRYDRICTVCQIVLSTTTTPCIILAERRPYAQGASSSEFKLHIMYPTIEDRETVLSSDAFRLSIEDQVKRYWAEYIVTGMASSRTGAKSVFATPITQHFSVRNMHGTWPMVIHGFEGPQALGPKIETVTQGDAVMLYRLGHLLESESLDDSHPWTERPTAENVYQSLWRVLQWRQSADITLLYRRHRSHYDMWMATVLMIGVYPYVAMALDQSRPRVYRPARLTDREKRHFRGVIRDTVSTAEAVAPSGESLSAYKPIGMWPSRRSSTTPKELEVSSPRRRTSVGPEIAQEIKAPAVVSGPVDAHDARFLAIRRAQEATQFQEPLFAKKAWARSKDSYAESRDWRRALLTHKHLLEAVSRQCFIFLYGHTGAKFWSAAMEKAPLVRGGINRVPWEEQLEYHAPIMGSPRYEEMVRELQRKRIPASQTLDAKVQRGGRVRTVTRLMMRQEAIAPTTTQTSLRKLDMQLFHLLSLAVGVSAKIESTRRVDLEYTMSAVLTSLAKDGLLRFSPWRPRTPEEPSSDLETTLVKRLRAGEQHMGGIGALALLAWEWGSAQGLEDFLAWVDHLWLSEIALDAPDGTITREIVDRFPVLLELVPNLRASVLMAPAPAPIPAPTPQVTLIPSGPPHAQKLLSFMEDLYGYGRGEVEARFGALIEGEPTRAASHYLNLGKIVPMLRGIPAAEADRPSRIYIGTTPDRGSFVNVASITVQYDVPTRRIAQEQQEQDPRPGDDETQQQQQQSTPSSACYGGGAKRHPRRKLIYQYSNWPRRRRR